LSIYKNYYHSAVPDITYSLESYQMYMILLRIWTHRSWCRRWWSRGRKRWTRLQFTADHSAGAFQPAFATPRLSNPTHPRHYFFLLHGIVALLLRELLPYMGWGAM